MAIDSQQKRMSATGCGRPYLRGHFPGTINEAWRLAAGNVFSGNALTPVSAGGLFRGGNIDGISSGGPFFADPLAV